MTELGAAEAWYEAQRLSAQARGDRRPSSVPLLVFGVLTLMAAPFMNEQLSLWSLGYWLVAGPAGFLAIAWLYRRRRLRAGVGSGRGSYAKAAVVLLGAFVLAVPLWIVPVPAIAVFLAVLAIRQRNAYLAACAAGFGVLGGLATFAVLDNLLYGAANALGWFRPGDGYFNGADIIVYAVLGVLMLAAGLLALRSERRLGRG
jgi:hypothetical protein